MVKLALSPATRTSAILIRSFAERERKSLYKRSILGWLWSLLGPLMAVAVYSLVFGVIYRAPPPVTANGRAEVFALYLFSGLVVWNVFTNIVTGAMRWMIDVSDLRKKTYFPTETAILGGAVATLLQSGLEAVVLITIMAVLVNISWTLVLLPLTLILTAGFGLGIGFAVAILNTRYRDIGHLVNIALSVTFFLVPIVYTSDMVPDRAYGLPVRRIMELNPLNAVIGVTRDAVYFLRTPSPGQLAAAAVWAAVSSVSGWVYFRHRSMEMSEEP